MEVNVQYLHRNCSRQHRGWSFATSAFALLCCFHIQASESLLENKSVLSLIRKGAENTVLCIFSLLSRIH